MATTEDEVNDNEDLSEEVLSEHEPLDSEVNLYVTINSVGDKHSPENEEN